MYVLEQVYEVRVLSPDKTLATLEKREGLDDLAELGDHLVHRGPFLGCVLDHARDQGLHEREVRVLLQNENCA